MCDLDLEAVRSFLNELDLNDIFDGSVETAKFFLATVESSVVSIKTEDVIDTTSGESGDDTPQFVTTSQPKSSRRFKTSEERRRQRVYDRRYHRKHKDELGAMHEAFFPGLRLFNELLAGRIEITTMTAARLRYLATAINDPNIKAEPIDAAGFGEIKSMENATAQLALNQKSLKIITNWTESWDQHKSGDSGKYFLRKSSANIQPAMERLAELGKELKWANSDLEQLVLRKTGGVWI